MGGSSSIRLIKHMTFIRISTSFPNSTTPTKQCMPKNPIPARRTAFKQLNGISWATAVYFLYENNRIAEAAKWFRYLAREYPNKPLIIGNLNSMPSQMSLDEFAIALVQEDIGDTSQDRTTAAVQGLLSRAYYELAIGEDDRYAGFKLLASKIYEHYQTATSSYQGGQQRVGLPPFADINRTVLNQLLDPKQGMPFAMRAVIRTQLGLPAESNLPPAPAISTNAPSNVSTSTNTATVPGK